MHDIFYVLEGHITLVPGDPDEAVRLALGEPIDVHPSQPHHVTNAGEGAATFLILQGLGDYDDEPRA